MKKKNSLSLLLFPVHFFNPMAIVMRCALSASFAGICVADAMRCGSTPTGSTARLLLNRQIHFSYQLVALR